MPRSRRCRDASTARNSSGASADGDAELLAVVRGGHGRVGGRGNARGDPHQHVDGAGRPPRRGARRPAGRRARPARPRPRRPSASSSRLRAFPWCTTARIGTPAAVATASSPAVVTSAPIAVGGQAPHHRDERQRLRGEHRAGGAAEPAERVHVLRGARVDVGGVEHLERRPELGREVGECATADRRTALGRTEGPREVPDAQRRSPCLAHVGSSSTTGVAAGIGPRRQPHPDHRVDDHREHRRGDRARPRSTPASARPRHRWW